MKKKSKKGKSWIGAIILLLILAVIAYLFLNGNGLGLGEGEGNGSVPSKSLEENTSETEDTTQTEDSTQTEDAAKLPNDIVITIKEDQVFIGDQEFHNADELKSYIEEIHTDERSYTLEEENSILATRDWVEAVFDELHLSLLETKNR